MGLLTSGQFQVRNWGEVIVGQAPLCADLLKHFDPVDRITSSARSSLGKAGGLLGERLKGALPREPPEGGFLTLLISSGPDALLPVIPYVAPVP